MLAISAILAASFACMSHAHNINDALARQSAANGLDPVVECGWREAAFDFAKVLQPERSPAELQSVSDALQLSTMCSNGSDVSKDDHESIDSSAAGRQLALAAKLDAARSEAKALLDATGTALFVNAATGSDENSGTSRAQALHSVQEALARSRAAAALPPVTIVLAANQTHRIAATLELGPSDSGLSIVADPEAPAGSPMPTLSGAQPLSLESQWEPLAPRGVGGSAAPGARGAEGEWVVLNATNAVYGATPSPTGPVINLTRTENAAACQALCDARASDGCSVFTWHDSTWPLEYKNTCWLRLDGVWAPVPENDHVAGHRLQPRNAWKANVGYTSGRQMPAGEIRSIFVSGGAGGDTGGGAQRRGIRARFPNADPERTRFPTGWIPPHSDMSEWVAPVVNYGSEVVEVDMSPYGTYPGMFQNFYLGIGGECERFDPPQSYWCQPNGRVANSTYWVRSPAALNVSQGALPNLPYTEDPRGAKGAVVNWWRGGHWFTLMARVAGEQAAPTGFGPNGTSMVLGQGGNQGAEGDSNPREWFIEGVVDELDSAEEFVLLDGVLYYRPNQTAGAPDASTEFEANPLRRLVHLQGAFGEPQASKFLPGNTPSPVREVGATVANVSFVGLRFTGTGPSYVESPHQTSTGGDWGVSREGALFLEGTTDVTIAGCFFERLDGNAVFVLDYNRGLTVSDSEFAWIGESAVVQQGVLDGPDARAGTQPRGTTIERMLCREVGIFEKQSSCYFQSASMLNTVRHSIFFNGPRAMLNQEDQIGGGSHYDANVIFNSCLETQDHSAINSWGRVPAISDLGPPSPPPITGTGGTGASSSSGYIGKDLVAQALEDRGRASADEGGSAIPQFNVMTDSFIIAGGFNGPEVGANGGAWDSDDGTSFLLLENTTSVLGGAKQDFDGHGMVHIGGLYLYSYVYGDACVRFSSVPEKHPDNTTLWDLGYINATCVLAAAGDPYLRIGGSCDLSKPGDLALQLGGNTVMVEGAAPSISVCGKSFTWEEWQATGVDLGTSVGQAPSPQEAVAMMRAHLHLPGATGTTSQ